MNASNNDYRCEHVLDGPSPRFALNIVLVLQVRVLNRVLNRAKSGLEIDISTEQTYFYNENLTIELQIWLLKRNPGI